MASHQLTADLDKILKRIKPLMQIIKLQTSAVAAGGDVAPLLRALAQLSSQKLFLDQAVSAAEKHIKSWDDESRWKRAKNLAIPKLTATRNALKAMVAQGKKVSKNIDDAAKYGKLLDMLAKAQKA